MNKLNLTNTIKAIEVFYDGRCGMCCTFIEWLERQERACELNFLDYHSDEATKVFPELLSYHPDKEMVVRVNGNEIYQGGEGWVCCLWSCANFQVLAKKMNSRLLLPVAKKICYLVSKNRLGVSKFFFAKKNGEIAAEVEKNDEIKCEGVCEK